MFSIIFENEHGKIQIGGGSHPFFRCKAISGLGLAKKEFNTIEYVGENGQDTISEKDLARTITIKGDLLGAQYELSQLAQVLYYEGQLKMQFGNKKRMIKCRCNELGEPERRGIYNEIVIQFICDDPEFTDFDQFMVSLFTREDLISSPFTFTAGSGLVFTKRINGADITNNGDLKTFPVFYIYNDSSESTETLNEQKDGILIENTTTGQKIELNYAARPDEEIIIDIENRSIKGIYNGTTTNLINYISNDTFLNKFWIDPGKNTIQITNYNTDQSITVECQYTNRYIEAVY